MREAGFEEIRSIQYEILKTTAQFCEAHYITYFLTGGTLLGAVRHQGFIPWDDDIDIAMPRPDYNRFLKESGGHLGEFYDISVFENNPLHARLFMRVVDRRTECRYRYYQKKYCTGLGIDVFPMDGVPEDAAQQKRYFADIRRLAMQFTLSQSAAFKSTGPVRAICKTAASIPARMIGREMLYQKVMEQTVQYPYETCRKVGITTGVYLEKEVLEKEALFPAVRLTFEDETFYAPACYDRYLRQLYGDYMQLPEEKARIRNHTFSVYWK